MSERNDFEHRLGQGLKRWAEDGKPTMDLEAYVLGRQVKPGRPRWMRWASGFVAAAAVVGGLVFTFPAWAGAAANWPIIGPVVKEIIMKDAGLQWAYESGFMKEPLAEVSVGGATVRILGVVADVRRTTVIYQIEGLPAWDGRPVRVGEEAYYERPSLSISSGKGSVTASWSGPPVQTPIGLVGTVNGSALQVESAEIEVVVRYREQEGRVSVPASRVETDRFSNEVAVSKSQEKDGVKVTLDSVIYTPVEMILHYRVEGPSFFGPGGWGYKQETDSAYIEAGGKRHYPTGGNSAIINGEYWTTFPLVKGPFAFVVQKDSKGLPVNLEWPLQEGAKQQYGPDEIVLTKVGVAGSHIDLEWQSTATYPFLGIGAIELVDAQGVTHELRTGGEGNNFYEGKLHRHKDGEFPAGFVPVAVRAKQVGVRVDGPWRFEVKP